MNPKTTIGLVAALVIAVLALVWARWSTSSEEVRKERPGPQALFEPALGELTGFELKAGDAPAMAFVREDRKWRMTAPVSGPGENALVNADSTKIKNLKYVRAYPKDEPERPTPEMTSLDSPRRIVKLSDESGRSVVLKIGARQALSKKTYVQKEGDDAIYLVDADLNRDLRRGLREYRGKRVSEFTQNDAVRIEVTGGRHYTLVKSGGGKWTVESPIKGRADASKVNALLSSISNLRVMKFVDDAPKSLRPYGLDPPRLRVAVTTETKTPKPPPAPPATAPAEPQYEVDTQTIRVAFGGIADKNVFAKIDEASSPGVFQVLSSVLDRIGPGLDDVRDKQITTINTLRGQKIVASCENESIELVKSGNTWEITGGTAGEMPRAAEFATVDDLLKAIRDLKAIGFESEALPAHGFDHPRARIEVTAEGRLEPATLVVGGLTPSKTGAYVRNEREGFVAVVKAEAAESLVVRPISFLSRRLLAFPRNRASRIELVRPDATCAVAREAGAWAFVAPIHGKASSKVVGDILSDLSNLRGRAVVGRAADAAEFGLDRPAMKATVTVQPPPKPTKPPTTQPVTTQPVEPAAETPEPPTHHTILVSRVGDKVYAMAAGGATICEVDGKVLDDLEAELLNTKVAQLDPADVHRLAFSNGTAYAFEKRDDDWVLAGEPTFATDATKITEVCGALRDLQAKRYARYDGAVPAEYGLDRPAVVVTAETDDGRSLTLMISATGPSDGDRYAAVSTTEGRVFVIKSEDAAKFSKQVQDFAKPG